MNVPVVHFAIFNSKNSRLVGVSIKHDSRIIWKLMSDKNVYVHESKAVCQSILRWLIQRKNQTTNFIVEISEV